MYERVNPSHPDKVADRIAGALVDMAYAKAENPKIAVEVLIGHGECNIIAETSIKLNKKDVKNAVWRIAGDETIIVRYKEFPQDEKLAENQSEKPRCGDNGIFKGVPMTDEEWKLSQFAQQIYNKYPTDGKFLIGADGKVTICQSNTTTSDIKKLFPWASVINPLGDWTGGINVDTGATNRKIGSDMGNSATGGGLHGKDLSKSDVSINIYAFLKAQKTNKTIEISCSIGDELVDGKPYSEVIKIARDYIVRLGGFEKFAEWGLVRADRN